MAQKALQAFFYVRPNGSEGYVRAAQVVEDDHEAVEGRSALFERVDEPKVDAPAKPEPVKGRARKASAPGRVLDESLLDD